MPPCPLKSSGCSKIVRSSPPQKAPRRRSSATPHKEDFEDGGEMAVFQQPAKEPTLVLQDDHTGCGIACAAMLAGKTYHAVKKRAKSLGIFPDDKTLNSDIQELRTLLEAYNIRIGKKEPFKNWKVLPTPAILAVNYRDDMESPSWHWAVFHRDETGAEVLDPSKKIKRNVRKDLGNVKPKWYIPVGSA